VIWFAKLDAERRGKTL